MIRFRGNVNPANVHPAIWLAIGAAYCIRRTIQRTPEDMWVTSLNDGTHEADSLHYVRNSPDKIYCRAGDIRTFDLTLDQRTEFYTLTRLTLRPLGYDVVLHPGSRGLLPNVQVAGVPEHQHIEWQPHTADENSWFPNLQVA